VSGAGAVNGAERTENVVERSRAERSRAVTYTSRPVSRRDKKRWSGEERAEGGRGAGTYSRETAESAAHSQLQPNS